MIPLLFVPSPLAGDIFDAVGEESTIGLGGTWARVHASEEAWWFFQVAGGDLWVGDLDADLSGFDERNRTAITGRSDLQDVQVERCEDGGWLAVGSATVEEFDDSAYAFRADVDFASVTSITVHEREADWAHNDMTLLCADVATGVAFNDGHMGNTSTFFEIGATSLGDSHGLDVTAMGSAFAVRPSDGRVVAATFDGAGSQEITFTVFDPDWSVVEQVQATVPSDYALWTQRLMPLGDGWLLVHVLRPDAFGEPAGEVWIQALDADFAIVDSIRASPEGSTTNNRPWIARRDGVIAVTYDRDVQPRITTVALKADAVPEDDGLPDTGPDAADDSGGTGGGGGEPGCGCGGGGTVGWWVLGLAALARRLTPASRPSPTP